MLGDGPSDRAEPEFLNKLNPGPLMAGREPRREQRVKVPAPRTESWWNAIAPGGDRKSRGTALMLISKAQPVRSWNRPDRDMPASHSQEWQSLKSFRGLRL